MTIKVYISGICGSQEVRKQQQRVLFILQSMPIDLQVIDITEPGKDEALIFMQETAKKHDKKTQLPPQIFNDDQYCGDYADFEVANDDDDIMKFLKLESGPSKAEILKSGGTIDDIITQNGIDNHDKDVSENMEINKTNHVGDGDLNKEDNDSIVINSDDKNAGVEKVEIAENESSGDKESQNVAEVKEESKEKVSSEEESEEESE